MVRSTLSTLPSSSETFDTFAAAKPWSAAVTVYDPGARAGNRYWPFASVTVLLTPTSAGLRASTVTPGRTPPALSLTVPSIDPPCSWAAAGAASASMAATIHRNCFISAAPQRRRPQDGTTCEVIAGIVRPWDGRSQSINVMRSSVAGHRRP